MMHFYTLLVIPALYAAACAASTPPGFTPSVGETLPVVFANNVAVDPPGLTLSQAEVASAPTLDKPSDASDDEVYAVIMVDPAINAEGTDTVALHWYQPELTVHTSTGVLTVSNTSAPAAAYLGPAPIPGPAHDYVILLYQQPAGYELPACLDVVLPTTNDARAGFNLGEFTHVAQLGTPVAANWFKVQNPTPPTTTFPVTSTSITSYACEATAH